MKQIFVKAIILLVLFFCESKNLFAQAEINTEFTNRMNYVFGQLDKSKVPTGFLLDYAMEFVELKCYNGLLTDTNKVSAGTLRDIYNTLWFSAIHTNAGSFRHPDYVDSLWQVQRQPGFIT